MTQAMAGALPVLYSFRRCPYAMRARMAISYSGVSVALREVVLRNKPELLLAQSPKGTVPVLILPEGRVIEQSVEIMQWALAENDPDNWTGGSDTALFEQTHRLIQENDQAFKKILDRYKYADRYPEHPMEYYRGQGEVFLMSLENCLKTNHYLLSDRITLADIALFPFVRQFAHVDEEWFEKTPCPRLQQWLAFQIESSLFVSVMQKYKPWEPGADVVIFP
ncbi:glutathione S-transferase [Sulfurirhabdus autotrophica]|uniref:Glutathione S-transferase n=1 Tax=Sulfurirhabdus autotrophica TaxID=1706046 RepID=A0A4V2W1Y5_9PROT|nr:glutathione S-transferase [Sulfurirhabdus autotrophica]TCV85909.1 glutathione S-transferase [Sulfurirhabdus autotrophica]